VILLARILFFQPHFDKAWVFLQGDRSGFDLMKARSNSPGLSILRRTAAPQKHANRHPE